MDGHQDTPVLHRSNYRARGQVQSWWGEWNIFRKLALQNLLKITNSIEIKFMDGHQDYHHCDKKLRNENDMWYVWVYLQKTAKSCKMVMKNHANHAQDYHQCDQL